MAPCSLNDSAVRGHAYTSPLVHVPLHVQWGATLC